MLTWTERLFCNYEEILKVTSAYQVPVSVTVGCTDSVCRSTNVFLSKLIHDTHAEVFAAAAVYLIYIITWCQQFLTSACYCIACCMMWLICHAGDRLQDSPLISADLLELSVPSILYILTSPIVITVKHLVLLASPSCDRNYDKERDEALKRARKRELLSKLDELLKQSWSFKP